MVDSYGPWRFCLRKCPEGYRCFQRKEAHCFRNGPGPLLCTPTAEECSALRVSNKAEEACRLTPADEL